MKIITLSTQYTGEFKRSCDDKILGQTDRQTDGQTDCTPRPAFAFGDACKNMFPFI